MEEKSKNSADAITVISHSMEDLTDLVCTYCGGKLRTVANAVLQSMDQIDLLGLAGSCPKCYPPPRPSFEEIFMRMAWLVAQRSTCSRLNVGCVIVRPDFRQVLSMGYNGNASGLPNQCDSTEPGKCGCIHAEQNAVINCDTPRYVDKIVFTTDLPCVMCAKFMVNLGNVQKVYYERDYRLRDGLEVLGAAGIVYEQAQLRIVGERSE